LRHGKTGERIDHEEDILSPIAEIFGNGSGHIGGTHPDQRMTVRCRHNDDGTAEALFTEILFEKFPYFPTPFTDQPDHVDVGFGITGDHTQQYALAHAGSGKYSHPLALPACKYTVYRLDAQIDGFVDAPPLQGIDGIGVNRIGGAHLYRTLIVNGLTETVDDPSEKLRSDFHGRLSSQGDYSGARTQSLDRIQGHEKNLPLFEAHHLRRDRFPGAGGMNGAQLAQGYRRSMTLHDKSNNFAYLSVDLDRIEVPQLVMVFREIDHRRFYVSRCPWMDCTACLTSLNC